MHHIQITLVDVLGVLNLFVCFGISWLCFNRIYLLNNRDYGHRFFWSYAGLAILAIAEAFEPFAGPYWQPFIKLLRGVEHAVWPTPIDVALNAAVFYWLWLNRKAWIDKPPEYMRQA